MSERKKHREGERRRPGMRRKKPEGIAPQEELRIIEEGQDRREEEKPADISGELTKKAERIAQDAARAGGKEADVVVSSKGATPEDIKEVSALNEKADKKIKSEKEILKLKLEAENRAAVLEAKVFELRDNFIKIWPEIPADIKNGPDFKDLKDYNGNIGKYIEDTVSYFDKTLYKGKLEAYEGIIKYLSGPLKKAVEAVNRERAKKEIDNLRFKKTKRYVKISRGEEEPLESWHEYNLKHTEEMLEIAQKGEDKEIIKYYEKRLAALKKAKEKWEAGRRKEGGGAISGERTGHKVGEGEKTIRHEEAQRLRAQKADEEMKKIFPEVPIEPKRVIEDVLKEKAAERQREIDVMNFGLEEAGGEKITTAENELSAEQNFSLITTADELSKLWGDIPEEVKNNPPFHFLTSEYNGDAHKYINNTFERYEEKGETKFDAYLEIMNILGELLERAKVAVEVVKEAGTEPKRPMEDVLKEEAAKRQELINSFDLEAVAPILEEVGVEASPEAMSMEEKEKKNGFWDRIKRTFGNNKEVGLQIIKTMAGTAASIAGVKSVYDVPAYFRQRFKTRGIFGIGKGIGGSTEDILAASWQTRQKADEKSGGGEITERTDVREAIDDLNKRLELTREGGQKGSEQRKLLAKLLRENRIKEAMNKEDREKEMEKILDLYTTTKITGMQAARETLNTAFVASGAYLLRGASYGFLDAAERYQKLNKEAERKGEKRGKFDLLIRTIVGGVKETFQEAVLAGGKEKTKLQKSLDFVKSWGRIARYAGIGGAALHPESLTHPVDKVLDALQGKVSLGEAVGNFQGNIERMADFYKKVGTGEIFKNYGEILKGAYVGEAKTGGTGQADANIKLSLEELRGQYPGLKYKMDIEDAEAKLKAVIEAETAALVSKAGEGTLSETILGNATIHKGEGVEHALIRQLEDKPEDFGFKGDEKNMAAVHKWAGGEAHKIALRAGYVDAASGEEVRVGAKGVEKVAYVLEKDNNGNIKVEEYLKGEDGKFSSQETHELAEDVKGAKFEGGEKDVYEYISRGKGVDVLHKAAAGDIPQYKEMLHETLGREIKVEFKNDYGLGMRGVDINGDGKAELIGITDSYGKNIGAFEIKNVGDMESVKKSVLKTLDNFKTAQGGKVEITVDNAQAAGIRLFDKEGLSQSDMDKIKFWTGHKNFLHRSEIAKEFFDLSEKANVKYDTVEFQDTFRRLPADLVKEQKVGYMKLFVGSQENTEEALKGLLGKDIENSGPVEREMGGELIIIHDAYGKKGFDLMLAQDKIGVDGPGRYNWGTKGWLGGVEPDKNISATTINTAKTIIENMSRELADKHPSALQ